MTQLSTPQYNKTCTPSPPLTHGPERQSLEPGWWRHAVVTWPAVARQVLMLASRVIQSHNTSTQLVANQSNAVAAGLEPKRPWNKFETHRKSVTEHSKLKNCTVWNEGFEFAVDLSVRFWRHAGVLFSVQWHWCHDNHLIHIRWRRTWEGTSSADCPSITRNNYR